MRLLSELQCPECAEVGRTQSELRHRRKLGRHIGGARRFCGAAEALGSAGGEWWSTGDGEVEDKPVGDRGPEPGSREVEVSSGDRCRAGWLGAASRGRMGLVLTALRCLPRPPTPLAPFSKQDTEGVSSRLGSEHHLDPLTGPSRGGRYLCWRRPSRLRSEEIPTHRVGLSPPDVCLTS